MFSLCMIRDLSYKAQEVLGTATFACRAMENFVCSLLWPVNLTCVLFSIHNDRTLKILIYK